MMYILFNPLANNGNGEKEAKAWKEQFAKCEAEFVNIIELKMSFFDGLTENDEVILCGGDGTLNRFANETYGYKFKNKLFLAKCGTGNDFYRDVLPYEKDGRVELTQFIQNLPVVTVNGMKRHFVNGIGYGIDGDTCLVGDQIKEKQPGIIVNYSKIAIGLLLKFAKNEQGKKYGFMPKVAKTVVDGKEMNFKNVWLCSTMVGKYYGGGMMAAPLQDRLNKEHTCSVIAYSSKGRLISFLRFPAFSGGKHKGKKYLINQVGKHIEVTFDQPCALQIDGEVVKDVLTYTVDFD